MVEGEKRVEEIQEWERYPVIDVDGKKYSLLWHAGESGFVPEIESILILPYPREYPPNVKIILKNGDGHQAFIDANPALDIIIETKREFTKGGGDWALIEEGKTEPLILYSKLLAQQITNREDEERIRKELNEIAKAEAKAKREEAMSEYVDGLRRERQAAEYKIFLDVMWWENMCSRYPL